MSDAKKIKIESHHEDGLVVRIEPDTFDAGINRIYIESGSEFNVMDTGEIDSGIDGMHGTTIRALYYAIEAAAVAHDEAEKLRDEVESLKQMLAVAA